MGLVAALIFSGVVGAPASAEAVALGKALFNDPRLSADGTVSCATCHDPAKAFTDGRPVSTGVFGRQGTRNAPSLLVAGSASSYFWDGRRTTLEEQVLDPFTNPVEFGLESQAELLRRARAAVARSGGPESSVSEAAAPTLEGIAEALAAYIRSLEEAPASPFDRFAEGDRGALTSAQRHGLELFRSAAGCSACHLLDGAAPLTDGLFHPVEIELAGLRPHLASLVREVVQSAPAAPADLGVFIARRADVAALGRFVITRDPKDLSHFRTPSLRNVARTAPYFHDGSVPTLALAVDREIYYRSTTQRPLVLNPAERNDLVAFLEALSSAGSPP